MVQTVKVCDHTSVGMIVRRDGTLLLIERKKPPFGFAPPSGHVDGDASYELAARRELAEETGLTAISLQSILEKDMPNACRRPDGSWHHWVVYECTVAGEVVASKQEVKQVRWVEANQIQQLAAKTALYNAGHTSDSEWETSPGLEPVWFEHFKELGFVE